MRNESSQKLWLLTLTSFATIHNKLEKRHNTNKGNLVESDHADLQPLRMKEDFSCLNKVTKWFDKIDIKGTDPQKLVSFSTGMVCEQPKFNCNWNGYAG